MTYQWRLMSQQPLTYERNLADSWPDASRIARSLREIPTSITSRIPFLELMKRHASEWNVADQAPYLRKLLTLIGFLGLHLNEEINSYPRGLYPSYQSDLFFRLCAHIVDITEIITYDIIIRDRDYVRSRLTWKPDRRKLYIGDVLVRVLYPQATQAEKILKAFQDAKWADSVVNPILDQHGRPDNVKAKDATDTLNAEQTGDIRIVFHPRGPEKPRGTPKKIIWDLA